MTSFLKELRAKNKIRQIEWGAEPSLDFKALEFVCEAGELGNEIKKLIRVKNGNKGSLTSIQKIQDEVGDVLITLDLLCSVLDIDIEKAVINKFNKTSQKLNMNTRFNLEEKY